MPPEIWKMPITSLFNSTTWPVQKSNRFWRIMVNYHKPAHHNHVCRCIIFTAANQHSSWLLVLKCIEKCANKFLKHTKLTGFILYPVTQKQLAWTSAKGSVTAPTDRPPTGCYLKLVDNTYGYFFIAKTDQETKGWKLEWLFSLSHPKSYWKHVCFLFLWPWI